MIKYFTLFLLLTSCGSDGGELMPDDSVPHFVPYSGGLWKFENGQRYWLKTINNVDGLVWEVG